MTLIKPDAVPAMQDTPKSTETQPQPQPVRTHASLIIESDWAEFGLVTPSATLEVDPESPFPQPARTKLSKTKLFWGEEWSSQYQRMILRFYIVNDGSPIDFYISRGSDSSDHKTGRAFATFGNATYKNDENTGDDFNSHWFFQKPVSSPTPTK